MPFLKQIMDDLSATSAVERVVFMKGTQIGGTEVGLNWLGYIIENTPGMALLVMDTMPTIKKNTRTRIDPMIAATPVLRQRISKTRANEPGNTHASKSFPGGELIMTGANAEGPLRSTPVRFVMLDEVDAYPLDVDKAGDPVDLAVERTATFEGMRKIFMVSSPRLESSSRIAKAFKEGNQQRYWVPCPLCGEFQTITWAKIKWPKDEPRKAYMACEHCGGVIEEHRKPAMLAAGEWRAEAAGDGVTASYHLSTLYSPQRPWGRIAADFLAAKSDPPRLKTWTNTRLGETWRDEGDIVIEAEVLMARNEEFDEDLAPQVLCITVGVDVQDDRLECETVAWGPGEESWSLDYSILSGSPAKVEVWAELDKLLLQKWHHPTRGEIGVSAACVDSGGHFTAQVLNFCALRERRRIWAIKGASGQGKPPFPRVASQSRKHGRLPVHIIGVDGLKESFYRRLAINLPGPGYSHFPEERDLAWFQQLTAERLLIKYSKGRRVQEWTVKPGTRNEALDCRIYAMAALEGLKMRGVWRALKADQFERKRRLDVPRETPGSEPVQPEAPPPTPPPRPSGGALAHRPSFLTGRSIGRPSFLQR